MFSHIVVGAADVTASKKFYDATLGELGIGAGAIDALGRAVFMAPTGLFVVTIPIDRSEASAARGGTIGFAAGSPEAVDNWHARGLENGGTTCEDPPGWRESDYGRLYAAYLRDPVGNKLCALYSGAAAL